MFSTFQVTFKVAPRIQHQFTAQKVNWLWSSWDGTENIENIDIIQENIENIDVIQENMENIDVIQENIENIDVI